MKCTQYGLYGQATFKNARAILFFAVEWSGQEDGLYPGSGGVPKAGPSPGQMWSSPGQTGPSNTDEPCCQEPTAPSKLFLFVRRHTYPKNRVLRNCGFTVSFKTRANCLIENQHRSVKLQTRVVDALLNLYLCILFEHSQSKTCVHHVHMNT